MAEETVGRDGKTARSGTRNWDIELARKLCSCGACHLCGFTSQEPPPVAALRMLFGANTPDEDER